MVISYMAPFEHRAKSRVRRQISLTAVSISPPMRSSMALDQLVHKVLLSGSILESQLQRTSARLEIEHDAWGMR